jgi:rare lipoprotein A
LKTKILFFIITLLFSINSYSQYKYVERGIASYYHDFLNNKITANGELYKPNELTAAHLTLPFNSIVSVTNLVNNKTITVRINDRGPYIDKRIIDLSKAAADSLDFLYQGLTNVVIKVIHYGKPDNLSNETADASVKKIKEISVKKDIQKKKIILPNIDSIPVDKKIKNKTQVNIVKEFSDKETENNYYGVQVSSFKNKENMLRFTEKLKKEFNDNICVQNVHINNTLFYRVIIGDFATNTEADALTKKIEDKYKGCFTIKYSK